MEGWWLWANRWQCTICTGISSTTSTIGEGENADSYVGMLKNTLLLVRDDPKLLDDGEETSKSQGRGW